MAEGPESVVDGFFGTLADRVDPGLFHGMSGVLRFDLTGGDAVQRWYVTLADGALRASHRGRRADTVVRCDRDLFEHIAQGTENAMASQLRGEVDVAGDLHLMMVFQKVFPGPPSSTGRRDPIEGRVVTERGRG